MPILKKNCPKCKSVQILRQQKYCDTCSKIVSSDYNKQYNKDRAETDNLYKTARWLKVRALAFQRNPFCVRCERAGQIADHIKEVKDGGEFYSLDNIQILCRACHNAKTAEEKGKRE